jgi:hypothetical protein
MKVPGAQLVEKPPILMILWDNPRNNVERFPIGSEKCK